MVFIIANKYYLLFSLTWTVHLRENICEIPNSEYLNFQAKISIMENLYLLSWNLTASWYLDFSDEGTGNNIKNVNFDVM